MNKFDYNERHILNATNKRWPQYAEMQVLVEHFMDDMEQLTDTNVIGPADLNLRRRLILEEADEFVDAVDANDFPKMVDALTDLLYVTYGAFVAFGVNSKTVFELVHEANMAKLGGPKDEHGKQLKPEGWVEPDVAGLLRAMGWEETR